jgi:hypothetical protein
MVEKRSEGQARALPLPFWKTPVKETLRKSLCGSCRGGRRGSLHPSQKFLRAHDSQIPQSLFEANFAAVW